MALQPPFLVFNGLCFVWGLGAGITLTQGRTILQIVAPPTHRARLMSLFQLGLGGGGPIGAFIAGSLAAVLGLKLAMVLPALAMAVLIGAVLVFSRIWTMRTVEWSRPDRRHGALAARIRRPDRARLLGGGAAQAEAERPPDVLQRRDQPGHVVVAVQRRRREPQPLGAARHGRIVDGLDVDRVALEQEVARLLAERRHRPRTPARCA